MIWFTFIQQLVLLNSNKKFAQNNLVVAKARKGRPMKCIIGLHDKSTEHFYLFVDGYPINRKVCKNCRKYILPESHLQFEKEQNNSSVEVLSTEFYSFYTTVTKTKYCSTSRPPDKVDEVDIPEVEQKLCEGYKVTSVKRLFDNVVFSIGDKVKMYGENNPWVISSFNANNVEVGEQLSHCSAGFIHTTCYVISIGLLTKLENNE